MRKSKQEALALIASMAGQLIPSDILNAAYNSRGKGQKHAAKGKPSGAAKFKREAAKRRNIRIRSKK